jgi:hypothetical protein
MSHQSNVFLTAVRSVPLFRQQQTVTLQRAEILRTVLLLLVAACAVSAAQAGTQAATECFDFCDYNYSQLNDKQVCAQMCLTKTHTYPDCDCRYTFPNGEWWEKFKSSSKSAIFPSNTAKTCSICYATCGHAHAAQGKDQCKDVVPVFDGRTEYGIFPVKKNRVIDDNKMMKICRTYRQFNRMHGHVYPNLTTCDREAFVEVYQYSCGAASSLRSRRDGPAGV